MKTIRIGNEVVGDRRPAFIIAEIGINHNGDIDKAESLISLAKKCGCQAVKFQKRTPDICVPKYMWQELKDTPWGRMTYIEYKQKLEFELEDYTLIDDMCHDINIMWTASCWDLESLEFIMAFDPPFLKLASASITDYDLLNAYDATGKPVIMSTGMSAHPEIKAAVACLNKDRTILLHCNSSYPAANEELNLLCIPTLRKRYDRLVGYSGHERGITTSSVAVAVGACVVERHITLDRSDYGTDQAASLEGPGLRRLCRDIRVIEEAMGDGIKRIYDSEEQVKSKLRRI
jgi:N-acetylneuraminate synthase